VSSCDPDQTNTPFEHLGQGLFVTSSEGGCVASPWSSFFVDGPNRRFVAERRDGHAPRKIELHTIDSAVQGLAGLDAADCLTLIEAITMTFCASDEWTRGQADLQGPLALLLRLLWLRAVRDGDPSGVKEVIRGQDGVCKIESVIQRFATSACEAGVPAGPNAAHSMAYTPGTSRLDYGPGNRGPRHSSVGMDPIDLDWVSLSSVIDVSHGWETGANSAASRTPEFDGIARMRASFDLLENHLANAQELLQSPDRSGNADIRQIFWKLFVVESCLRATLEVLRGDQVEGHPTSGANETRSWSPGMVGLVAAGELVRVHRLMGQLLILRLRLWQLPSAEDRLDAELSLLGFRRPADDVLAVSRVFTFDHFREESDRRLLEAFEGAVPAPVFRDPFFPIPSDRIGFERLEARWFNRRNSRMLKRWETKCRRSADIATSFGASTLPGKVRALVLPVMDWLDGRMFTALGLALLCFCALLWCTQHIPTIAGISIGDTVIGSALRDSMPWTMCDWMPWFARGYLVAQTALLAGGVAARESRANLPRTFFGTGFIWLVALFPAVELLHKLASATDMKEKDQPDLHFLVLHQCKSYMATLFVGALFTHALLMLQVRGVRRSGATGMRGGLGLRRLVEDLWLGLKVLGHSCLLSWWWGSVVMCGALGLGVIDTNAFNEAFPAILPLGVWAVALAFLSQLMWQDQFLTEPLGFDR
jgi:hypothetical protein